MPTSIEDQVPQRPPGTLDVLGDVESLELLASMPFGRIVFTHDALPAVHPVNFVIDDHAVIIRTAPGSQLSTATNGTIVAFQTDDIDLTTRSGWTVTVIGHASHVTDAGERERLTTMPLHAWAAGDRDLFIRIDVELVHGRRLRRA